MKIAFKGLIASLILAFQVSVSAQEKPNILLLWADDLAPHLGCYGNTQVRTPHIDEFARDAVQFNEVHCQVTMCHPTRSGILVGVRPETSGIYGSPWFRDIPHLENAVTLPKHFSNHGYRTISIGKIADPRTGKDQQNDPLTGEGWYGEWDEKLHEFEWGVSWNRIEQYGNPVIPKLNELKDETKPWFFAVGFEATHAPWNPLPVFLDQYDIEQIELRGQHSTYTFAYNWQTTAYAPSGDTLPRTINEEQAKDITLRYYAEVTQLDSLFGEVIQETKRLGLYGNTIIIFWCGDHGFHLGENRHWGKWRAYRASSWVPMLVKAPGRGKGGTHTDALVETVDMYPSLVDLAGLPPPPGSQLEGISWVPLLDNPGMSWKKAVFSYYRTSDTLYSAVKNARYDLCVSEARKSSGSRIELFDMVKDPLETSNIANDQPCILLKMQKLMEDGWLSAFPGIDHVLQYKAMSK